MKKLFIIVLLSVTVIIFLKAYYLKVQQKV